MTAGPFTTVGFFDASRGGCWRVGGTGLGLVIGRRLVDAMHGTLPVVGQARVGSTFTFTASADARPDAGARRPCRHAAHPRRARRPAATYRAQTANVSADDSRACLLAGMDEHLIEPVTPTSMRSSPVCGRPAAAASGTVPARRRHSAGEPVQASGVRPPVGPPCQAGRALTEQHAP